MKKKRRILSWLMAVALFTALSLPMPVSAANLYFTAINNSVAFLTSDTMPLWYNGRYALLVGRHALCALYRL